MDMPEGQSSTLPHQCSSPVALSDWLRDARAWEVPASGYDGWAIAASSLTFRAQTRDTWATSLHRGGGSTCSMVLVSLLLCAVWLSRHGPQLATPVNSGEYDQFPDFGTRPERLRVKDKHVDTPVPLHGGSKYHGFDKDNRTTLDSATGLHVEMRRVTSAAKDSHVDDASTLPDLLSQLVTQPATV